MPKDLESRLDAIEEKLEENNVLLRKIRKREVWRFWFGIVKILIVIGAFYWGFVFLEPYLRDFYNAYQTVVDTSLKIKDAVPSPGLSNDIKTLIEKFSGGN